MTLNVYSAMKCFIHELHSDRRRATTTRGYRRKETQASTRERRSRHTGKHKARRKLLDTNAILSVAPFQPLQCWRKCHWLSIFVGRGFVPRRARSSSWSIAGSSPVDTLDFTLHHDYPAARVTRTLLAAIAVNHIEDSISILLLWLHF